jgi:hypothetical protein
MKDKLSSDDDVSTVLEGDEELGDGESSDNGIDTLLDDVEGLIERRDRAKSGSSTAYHRDAVIDQEKTPANRVLGSLKNMDAPRELCDATALLLQSTLLDEDTAMLLTRDIMNLSVNDDEPSASGTVETDHLLPESNYCDEEGATQDDDINMNEEIVDEAAPNESLDMPRDGTIMTTENEKMLKPSIFTMHSFTATEPKEND